MTKPADPIKFAECIFCKRSFAVHDTDGDFLICHDCEEEWRDENR